MAVLGIISCPITTGAITEYKDKFKSLSRQNFSKVNGVIYLRGVDPIGVVITTLSPETDTRWINRPELNNDAVNKHKLSVKDLLRMMIHDGIYQCGGTMIEITKDDVEMVEALKNWPELTLFCNGDMITGQVRGALEEQAAEKSEVNYLPFIESCQEAIKTNWSLDAIDPYAVKKIEETLDEFLLEKCDHIKKLYQYAENQEKYTTIPDEYDFEGILVKYDEYFNDLTAYVRAVRSQTEIEANVSDLEKRIVKAIDVDEQFRKDLYKRKPITMFSKAVECLNVFIDLHPFLENVYDNFLEFTTKKPEKTNMDIYTALLNLYGYSVTQFLDSFINELYRSVYALDRIMLGERPKNPETNKPYVLI